MNLRGLKIRRVIDPKIYNPSFKVIKPDCSGLFIIGIDNQNSFSQDAHHFSLSSDIAVYCFTSIQVIKSNVCDDPNRWFKIITAIGYVAWFTHCSFKDCSFCSLVYPRQVT